MIEDAISQPAAFVRGNDDLDRLLATPRSPRTSVRPALRPKKWIGSTQ